ncbi:MAG: nitroreductase family protein [Candidatus Omnitrophica bacterium]|nr:nitroreductase family protein [Candidatus Omnitrophota bacterium]
MDDAKYILQIIKRRASSRRYSDKPVPQEVIDNILEAGRWGPSVHRQQSWRFISVSDKNTILRIADICDQKAANLETGGNNFGGRIIRGAAFCVFAYNTGLLSGPLKKFKKMTYAELAHLAEIQSIAAGIQNMILTAEGYNLGSCWLNMPLVCQQEINACLNEHQELIAVVTFGFSQDSPKRENRAEGLIRKIL